MRSLDQLLSHTRHLGVKLWVEEEKLRYRAPKGVLSSDLKSELSDRKDEIRTFLQQAQRTLEQASNPIAPAPRDIDLPLSFAQQRLWFLDQLSAGRTTYNESLALEIVGHLQVSVLQKSLMTVMQRHEVLRTNFKVVNGSPVQVIASMPQVPLSVVDLQAVPESIQSVLMPRLAAEEADRPFDLSNDRLLRFLLIQLEADRQVLVLTMHHIVSDGWSIGVLVREVSGLYEAVLAGQPSPLPELPIQYADFAYWQRQWLQGEVLQKHLTYWQQQLRGAPQRLTLPTDYARPAVQKFRGARLAFALPQELANRLQTLSQQSDVTLFMTLLAAFGVLLQRYSGQDDLVIGTPIANRNRPEIEPLIGFFINTLALRIRLQETLSFQALLRQVRHVTLDAYAHQDLPFEQVVEAMQPERSLSHAPLFQVAFALQNAPIDRLQSPGLTFAPLEKPNVHTKLDLLLSMRETEAGLSGVWEYDRDLFASATLERMATHFQSLLEAIATHPDRSLSDFTLLSPAERQQILVQWNQTQRNYPPYQSIHQQFETHAERTPEAIAVVFEQQCLTYQALDARANQLAHHLRDLGVGPEDLVGLSVDRSLDMVIGLLGILKAGGAYVPIDPDYPPERLAFILEDAQPSVILTQAHVLESLPAGQSSVVCLDRDGSIISQQPVSSPEHPVQPEQLAYVIYTSGSTGTPKGVLLNHGGLCNLAATQTELFAVGSDSRILQFASLNFDASVWEIVMALGSGASLVLASPAALMPGEDLRRTLSTQRISHITLPPSALALLNLEALPALRHVIVAGEACPIDLAHRWSEVYQVWNAYGPTEGTVCATISPVHPEAQSLSIGRAIANTQVYILNRQLQPVPIGVIGELYIGGAGVARAYLNRPALTAEKFVANPFGSGRLYKTGDSARYLPDGTIDFGGRLDHQIKIRGFRIELGEIEAVLNRHELVQHCAVIACAVSSETKYLAAYVVSDTESDTESNTELDSGALKAFLRQHLPDYMVPSVFVPLAALPLLPNGKVDRQALPAVDQSIARTTTQFVKPESALEKQLADIWQSLLPVAQVGVYDSFFDLGGNSMLLIQMHYALQEKLSVSLSVADLFAYPTLRALSDYLSKRAIQQDVQPAERTRKSRASRTQIRTVRQRQHQLRQHSRLNL
ncbi:amino acid adenylation domain-containing protein [Oscillatoria sp. CS-180]|uniref:non-ribosomal peptide synthetase n=1 Tax=Oscillatoria sp. CS-180 TaxID=3021720 RepID=UPI00232DE8B2|nr:amino acid adenylation domain-containing protein [Oscillatoria sp. CS-180]MDB9527420.1 amino acid adenylation domain-containing protein [Oscillatoria sp. CS-180]